MEPGSRGGKPARGSRQGCLMLTAQLAWSASPQTWPQAKPAWWGHSPPLLCLRLGFAKATCIPEALIGFWKPRPPPTAYLRLERRGAQAFPLHIAGAAGQDPPPHAHAPATSSQNHRQCSFKEPQRAPSTLLQMTLALPILWGASPHSPGSTNQLHPFLRTKSTYFKNTLKILWL